MGQVEKLRAEIARLTAQIEANSKAELAGIRLKVGEKGGVSLYGIERFPVTKYAEQWLKMFELKDTIVEFIRTNCDKGLKFKHAESTLLSLGVDKAKARAVAIAQGQTGGVKVDTPTPTPKQDEGKGESTGEQTNDPPANGQDPHPEA